MSEIQSEVVLFSWGVLGHACNPRTLEVRREGSELPVVTGCDGQEVWA